ncbi:hypothetical protein CPB83DRAFT_266599 [Crepidotus variabilis]|uniref:Uncharacterized protein n=1 Tax=Crepidotus variabilis TaxID=179855 RepID=A0A9P6JQB1_9AGAR|nr:hypothetical protein CPB83DRAFT_266599 [Crepidotus variabilis]
MDSSFSTSPRRSHDIPKPDTGLAEWTSKIKAIQRQVDADEEDEQKRLEEEIAAARQARLRRSRGMGGGSRADSLDLSQSREQLGLSDSMSDMSFNDVPKSFSERENDRETALRKLMDRNKVYNPDRIGSTTTTTKTPSLAGFMGGHASGPRLNKHAPQQDAHDPTQFSQPDLSAPHPVFGSGGVAMPGMAAKREAKSPGPIRGSDLSERYRPSSTTKSKSVPLKDDYGLEESTKEMNRRSFSATPKSPSPALSSRYSEKFNSSSTQETKPPADSVITQRKSFSSIPKSTSPLPQPIEDPPVEPVVAKKKSFGSIPKVTSSTPSAVAESPAYEAKSPPLRPADFYRSPSASTPSKSVSPYITPSYLGTPSSTVSAPKSPNISKPTSYAAPSYLGTGNTTPSSTNRSGGVSTPSKDETPLRRLMEKNNVYNPDRGTSDNTRKSVAERAQTTSLAAFMGAPGKGIRLNKHAPQVDAHDPTQFTQPDTTTPHPVFGRGGIAMPVVLRNLLQPRRRHGLPLQHPL